jgi:lipopolysaccharide exporter
VSVHGVWALVAQPLVCFLRMAFLNVMRPFRPRFEFSLKSLLSHIGVGAGILGTRVMELGGRLVENSQGSRTLGSVELGGYGYANQIGRFFSDAVSNPISANLYYIAINKTPDEVNRHYIISHHLFALLMFPSAILLALALPALVPLILGPDWAHSTFPTLIMVLRLSVRRLGTYHGAIMFARASWA